MNNSQNLFLQNLLATLQTKLRLLLNESNQQTANSKRIYEEAKAVLGTSVVPLGYDPALACAVTVNQIALRAIGVQIGGDASTAEMYKILLNSGRFLIIMDGYQLPGDIVISPTGSPNVNFAHGHVGIVGYSGILSNSSLDGKVHEYYTIKSWKDYYVIKGGYPMYFFRIK